MKSSYKRLGDYIEPVNQLNDNMEVTELLGISNNKHFQDSHTNTIGIDLTTYRVVRNGQFAYNRATTRNGDKISIALRQGPDCIVSPSYRIFRSKDENKLDSEYLMMWFRRPEFDRYARFKSHGSAHEFFEWEQMTEVELPIPSITKQREIVKEYNTIQKRIELNQQMIQKLEETAQAIYKRWFVEFEFPDENGRPYKSSGNPMTWNSALNQEIPVGWNYTSLSKNCTLSQGIQVEVEDQFLEREIGMNRFLRIIDYTPNTKEPPRYVKINDSRYFCSTDDIAMIRYGDAGTVCRRIEGILANNLFKIIPLNPISKNFLYQFLKNENTQKLIRTSAASSTLPAITHSSIRELPIIIPPHREILFFDFKMQLLENEIIKRQEEIDKLYYLKELFLSKLSTIES